jgi:hypothetical protein
MAPQLKPSKPAALLLQERVRELLSQPGLPDPERVELSELDKELDAYLKS